MILLYSILIALGITSTVSAMGLCFQLTWNININQTASVNCTNIPKNKPCYPPMVYTADFTPPNMTDIWRHRNRTMYTCPLRGSACIKYSVTSNDAVQHIAYFCGKMIQNNNTELTSGCYTSQAGVETIEACACETRGDNNNFPCNASNSLEVSINFIIVLTLISMIRGGDYTFFNRLLLHD